MRSNCYGNKGIQVYFLDVQMYFESEIMTDLMFVRNEFQTQIVYM